MMTFFVQDAWETGHNHFLYSHHSFEISTWDLVRNLTSASRSVVSPVFQKPSHDKIGFLRNIFFWTQFWYHRKWEKSLRVVTASTSCVPPPKANEMNLELELRTARKFNRRTSLKGKCTYQHFSQRLVRLRCLKTWDIEMTR